MAMYCQGSSEIQADALQTICLMNPNYVGYSDTHHQPQPSTLFLNSSTTAVHGLNSTVSPHAPLHQARQFWGIPLSHDTSRPPSVLGWQEDIQAVPHSSISSFRCNQWGLDVDTAEQANMPQQTPHALSLGLAPHQTGFDKPLPNRHHQDFPRKKCSSPSLTTIDLSKGVNLMPSVIIGSKYIKAAQELLDEVANVVDRKGTAIDRPKGSRDKAKIIKETAANASSGGGDHSGNRGDHSGNKGGGAELTTAQRQEITVKKAKLNCLLDEVEQRSRMYHHQMQTVVASFEQAAGIGSAKSYTQLAQKTILKQFRRLKSAISWQIKALKKSLGEEECSGGNLGGSRLGFLDHHLRQLETMQNNAWRPHRGLPERAVSVLRAWLFDHFLHPYPKDSDKQRLATQTGLTKSQVSNWFINARVRLWKPTVEEMYQEEMKNQEQHISSQENAPKAGSDRESGSKQNAPLDNINSRIPAADQHKTLQTKQGKLMLDLQVPSPTEISASTVVAASPTGSSLRPHPGFAQLNIGSIYMENLEKNPKKPRSGAQDESPGGVILPGEMEKKAGRITESYLSMAAPNTNLSPGTGFGAYGLCEPGRFNADPQQLATGFQGNNFSLTLGLPPSETSQGARQYSFPSARNFGTRIQTGAAESSRIINGINQVPSAASHPNAGYEILDFHDRRPFPTQFLPDFVA